MNLPRAPLQYDSNDQARTRGILERVDKGNRKITDNVEIGPQKLVLTSPNGVRWSVVVSNTGVLSATAL